MTSRFERIFITHLWLLFGCGLMELWVFLIYDHDAYSVVLNEPSFIGKILWGLMYLYFGGGGMLFLFGTLFGWVANALEPSTSNFIDGDE